MNTIDWNGKVRMSELQVALDDDAADNVEIEVGRLSSDANEGRVMTTSDAGFAKKVANYAAVVASRIGTDKFTDAMKEQAFGIIDYGKSNTGKRGILFSKFGVFSVTNDYPKIENGDMRGGLMPWKLFYKFAEAVPGKSFWRIKFSDVLESDEVCQDVKDNFDEGDRDFKYLLHFTEAETGLSSERMSEFLDAIKAALADDEMLDDDEDDEEEQVESGETGSVRKWICPVCDHVYEGTCAPTQPCPDCGIPGSKFKEIGDVQGDEASKNSDKLGSGGDSEDDEFDEEEE